MASDTDFTTIMDTFLSLKEDVIRGFKEAVQKYKDHVQEIVVETNTRMQLVIDNYGDQKQEAFAHLQEVYDDAIKAVNEYTEELINMMMNSWEKSIASVEELTASIEQNARILQTMLKKIYDEVLESMTRQIEAVINEIRTHAADVCMKQAAIFENLGKQLKD